MPAPIVARYGKSVIAARTAFVRHVAGNAEYPDAYFGRYAERLDDAQVRVENQGDCRTAYLWGNKAASCTHAHDYVMGRHRQRQ